MNKLSLLGGLIVVIGHIYLIIQCGIWAWNWVDPDGFWGGVGFLVVWGIFDYIAHVAIMGLAAMLFSKE
jgi:hypothetical protein